VIPEFFTDHATISERIASLKPAAYSRSRNHLSGAVTYLSPFITHGIIDTRTVAEQVLQRYASSTSEKLLTELAWREFFHRTWQINGDDIFADLRHPQEDVISDQIPAAITQATTGIQTIDQCISALIKTGYMHNHARMWLAAISCNLAKTHWYQPARWLYYHLLDGDLASNSLSWQWVCGSFSHRKYLANQDNLNRYSDTEQHDTFLDVSYSELAQAPVPEVLQRRTDCKLFNQYPASTATPIENSSEAILLYSIWNLDRDWRKNDSARRVLWIEPQMHEPMPLGPLRWEFISHWAASIPGLEVFVGSRDELFPNGFDAQNTTTREYPATAHWPGQRDERRWCYPLPQGSIRSFSSYWKKARPLSEFFQI